MGNEVVASVIWRFPIIMRVRRWLLRPIIHREDRLPSEFRAFRLVWVAESLLWLLAISGIGGSLSVYVSAYIHQGRQMRRFGIASSGTGTPASGSFSNDFATAERPPIKADDILGIIQIPRLTISAVVEEGVDGGTLSQAVGHIPGTKLPGENGNSGLAAHRDTYFRNLRDVELGDEIIFKTTNVRYLFKVQGTRIVDPSDISVLSNSADKILTLVTCFPFHYIGPAPKRFVVTAKLDKAFSTDQ